MTGGAFGSMIAQFFHLTSAERKTLLVFPVVDRERRRLVGMVALFDLLEARARNLDAERRRERILGVRQWRRRRRGDVPVAVRPGV